MNIQILDSHLREFLKTTAKPEKIAECLSLCGPSVDHLTQFGKSKDYIYDIEITTNRVDTASVIGIAREAAAILPQFRINAKLKMPYSKLQFKTRKSIKSLPLKIQIDKKLNKRVMAAVMEIKNNKTPKWMIDRLEAAGMRSLNIIIDITNYIMLETGHPTHVFDYDKIPTNTLRFRLSKKGEKITTLDTKVYQLDGGDIVIDDGNGKIIDLPGIMGTKNSVVSDKTRRIIFFIDNNDPVLMRRTSLALNIRTIAVQLNEKSVDPELAQVAMDRGLSLYQQLAEGIVLSKVQDFYPEPYKPRNIAVDFKFINSKIGVELDKKMVISILNSLDFATTVKGEVLTAKVPSFRAHEVEIAEDLVEEVARVYGYFNLPNEIMDGKLPLEPKSLLFEFENKLKDTLGGFGATEVYTLSLVSKKLAGKSALKLKNPLGGDTEYLRTSLKPSLELAAKENSGEKSPFHLFEIANVYLPRTSDLPDEKTILAGVFVNYDYRAAKGVLEALFSSLNINHKPELRLEGGRLYYEFEIEKLLELAKPKSYKPPPKYPPQIEDITVQIPEGKPIGEVIQLIKSASKLVSSVELVDIYERSFTFRVSYQDPGKTLSDKEVSKARDQILRGL